MKECTSETSMTPAHQAHLKDILDEFVDKARTKYIKGNVEHGGALWLKPGLLDMAMDEVLDQWIYLYTLKQQLNNKVDYPFVPLHDRTMPLRSENEA